MDRLKITEINNIGPYFAHYLRGLDDDKCGFQVSLCIRSNLVLHCGNMWRKEKGNIVGIIVGPVLASNPNVAS